jgi:Rieske Fe-S protein
MSAGPAWKEDFPVAWSDDHHVTRRDFAKSLAAVSCASFAASGALAVAGARGAEAGPPEPRLVAGLEELPVGGSKGFDFPGPGEPCLLIRLAADRWVAFGRRCTHLGCPVRFPPERGDLQCPCHEGYFRAEDGSVLSGPPPRPLPRVDLERRADGLWAVGVRR